MLKKPISKNINLIKTIVDIFVSFTFAISFFTAVLILLMAVLSTIKTVTITIGN